MLIETTGDIVNRHARAAANAANQAQTAADNVAALYGQAPLAGRPALLALTQAADNAAILARQAAAQALDLAAMDPQDWPSHPETTLTHLADDARRYARDATRVAILAANA